MDVNGAASATANSPKRGTQQLKPTGSVTKSLALPSSASGRFAVLSGTSKWDDCALLQAFNLRHGKPCFDHGLLTRHCAGGEKRLDPREGPSR